MTHTEQGELRLPTTQRLQAQSIPLTFRGQPAGTSTFSELHGHQTSADTDTYDQTAAFIARWEGKSIPDNKKAYQADKGATFCRAHFTGLASEPAEKSEAVRPLPFVVLDIDAGTREQLTEAFERCKELPDLKAMYGSISHSRTGAFYAIFHCNLARGAAIPFNAYKAAYKFAHDAIVAELEGMVDGLRIASQTSPTQSRYIVHASAHHANPAPIDQRRTRRLNANANAQFEPCEPRVYDLKRGFLSSYASELFDHVKAHDRTLVSAPTGTGKTFTVCSDGGGRTSIMARVKNELKQNCAFLVPLISIAEQTSKEYGLPLVTGESDTAELQSAIQVGKCVCTYDSFHKIEKWFECVFIDEAHEVVNGVGFRSKQIARMFAACEGKRVCLISATPPKLFGAIGYQPLEFKAEKRQVSVKMYDSKGSEADKAFEHILKHSSSADLQVVHLQSKSAIEAVKTRLSAVKCYKASEVAVIYRREDLEGCEVYQQLLDKANWHSDKQTFSDEIKLVLTTSIIECGVNILATNSRVHMAFIATDYHPNSDSIIQFLARIRESKSLEFSIYCKKTKAGGRKAVPVRTQTEAMEQFAGKASGEKGAFFNDGGDVALTSFFGMCNRAGISEDDALDYASGFADYDNRQAKKTARSVYRRYSEQFGKQAARVGQTIEQNFVNRVTLAGTLCHKFNESQNVYESFNLDTSFSLEMRDVALASERYVPNIPEIMHQVTDRARKQTGFADLVEVLKGYGYLQIEVVNGYCAKKDSELEAIKNAAKLLAEDAQKELYKIFSSNLELLLEIVFSLTKNSGLRKKLRAAYYFNGKQLSAPAAELYEKNVHLFSKYSDFAELVAHRFLSLTDLGLLGAETEALIFRGKKSGLKSRLFDLTEPVKLTTPEQYIKASDRLKTAIMMHLPDGELSNRQQGQKRKFEKVAERLEGKTLTKKEVLTEVKKADWRQKEEGKAVALALALMGFVAGKSGRLKSFRFGAVATLESVCKSLSIDYGQLLERISEKGQAARAGSELVDLLRDSEGKAGAPASSDAEETDVFSNIPEDIEVPF